MALNFPSDTSSPYIDPSTGIKYIYNTSVGAWEAAIQPPTIVSNTTPTTTIDGFLWWDADDEALYVYQGGAWRTVTSGASAGATVSVSGTPPSAPTTGDLWWDTESGMLFVYYTDPDGGTFWTEASPSVTGGTGGGVTASTSAPAEAVQGDLWLNTLTNVLYVYNNNSWVSTQPPSTGVQSVSGTVPISVTGTAADPIISINSASTISQGIIEIADQNEVNAGTDINKAITPATLATTLANITLPIGAATETFAGIVELATISEAETGTDTDRAVTPAGLAAALALLAGTTGNPSGTVINFAGSTAPTGYFECDGSLVSRTTYADLFAAIGTLYGAGDGSTTFQLPDLRGEFVRGWDNGRGVDSGRGIATNQSSANLSHTHTASDSGHTHTLTTNSGGGGGISAVTDSGILGSTTTNTSYANITVSADGESEARPRNISMMYCIKI